MSDDGSPLSQISDLELALKLSRFAGAYLQFIETSMHNANPDQICPPVAIGPLIEAARRLAHHNHSVGA